MNTIKKSLWIGMDDSAPVLSAGAGQTGRHTPHDAWVEALGWSQQRLTLVCAPPGSGKSRLLGELHLMLSDNSTAIDCIRIDLADGGDAAVTLTQIAQQLTALTPTSREKFRQHSLSAPALVSAISRQLPGCARPLRIFVDGLVAGRDDSLLHWLLQPGLSQAADVRWFVAMDGMPDAALAALLSTAQARLVDAAELMLATASLPPELNPSAFTWLADAMRLPPSLRTPAVLTLAGRWCRRWMQQHDARAVLHLLAPVPMDESLAHANTALPLLWALIIELRLDEAADLLKKIRPETLLQDSCLPFAEIDNTLEACSLLIRLSGDESLAAGQRLTLLGRITEKTGPLQTELLNRHAALLYGSGHIPLAKAVARRSLHIAQQQDDVIQLQLSRTQMLLCDFVQGHLDAVVAEVEQDAEGLCRRLCALDPGAVDPALELAIAINDCTRAYLFYECGRVADAEPLLAPALARIAPCHFSLPLTLATITRARILLRSGQQLAAEQMLEQLDEMVEIQRNRRLRAFVCFEKMCQRLAAGVRADDLITRYELDAQPVQVETLFRDQFQEEHLFWLKSRIVALLMNADYAAASEYALKGVIKSLNIGSFRHLATFYLFKALSEFRLGRYQDAKATGNRALDLCWQHGYRQLLVDQARTLQDLWQQLQRQGDISSLPDADFLRGLLMRAEPGRVTLRPVGAVLQARDVGADLRRDLGLTDKEVEILALLAEGLCNKKIGSRASIALTTVKWHLQNIFSKLDVRNRTEAVLKAQDLGLLDNGIKLI